MRKLITLLGILAASCSPLPAQNTLAGNLTVQQTVKLTGAASPSQLTSNVDDYAPTGFATAAVLRLQSDVPRTITGLAGGAAGRMVWLTNVGAQTLSLATESASSAAANRFAFGASSFDLVAGGSISIWYDTTSSRWRSATNLAAGGGGGTVDQTARDAAAAAQATADGKQDALSNASTLAKITEAAGLPLWDGSTWPGGGGGGTGTVTGPASSTDNALVRFDSTTGTSIQNSTITLADTGALAGVDAAQFVATPTSAAADRSLRWNSTEKTLDLVNGDGTTTQLGHEQHVVIHNATGSALAEGKVVSLTGATLGGRLTAALARADQYSTSDATIGITTQAIANGVEGKVTTSGIIHDLDTSAFSPGDELYLSDTVAGGLRTTQPLAPNLVVHVGHVVVSDAVVGSIYVDPAVVSQTADSVHIDAGPGVLEMNNVQDFFRHAWSTGATEGFALTDNGDGTVNIATGEIVYRETDADDAVLTPTVVPAVTNLAMQANNVSYLYLQYGTGWQVGTALNQFDGITKVIVYLVGRNGNRLNVVDLRKINVDFGRKSRRQKAEFDGFVFGGWWRSVEAQSAIT